MKRFLIQFVILALSIAVVLLLYTNNKLRNTLIHPVNNAHYENLRVENILLKEGFFHSYDFSTINIDMERCLINHNSDTLNLRELAKGKTTLVLFVNFGSCGSCIVENIHSVNELRDNTKLNVLVGIGGIDARGFNAFVKTNEIEEFSYYLPESFFAGFYFSSIVYFVIDKSFRTNCFYAPSDVFPELTNDYYSKVKNMYGV